MLSGLRRRASCGSELRHPDDRAGDEVREERQVDREVEERDRLLVLAIDVDQVADRGEEEEGDPDRQHDPHTIDVGARPTGSRSEIRESTKKP